MWQKLTSKPKDERKQSLAEKWQEYEENQGRNVNSRTQAADDSLDALKNRIMQCQTEVAQSNARTEKMRAQLLAEGSPNPLIHPRLEELRTMRDSAVKYYNDSVLKRKQEIESDQKYVNLIRDVAEQRERIQTEADAYAKELSLCDANAMILESEIASIQSELNNFSFLDDAATCQAQVDKHLETYTGVEELSEQLRRLEQSTFQCKDSCVRP